MASLPTGIFRHGGQYYSGSEIFNTDTANQWTVSQGAWRSFSAGSYAPGPRSRHCAVNYHDNVIIYAGRYRTTDDRRTVDYADLWMMSPSSTNNNYNYNNYNSTTYSWTQLASNAAAGGSVPPARSGHSCVLRGDYLVVYGGYQSPYGDLLADLWAYHIPTSTWYQMTSESPQQGDLLGLAFIGPPSLYGHSAVYVPGSDVMLLQGGRTVGASSMTANANFQSATYALVFYPDNSNSNGFNAPRAFWVLLPIVTWAPPRAFAAAWYWAGAANSLCTWGGADSISFQYGERLRSETLCLSGLAPWLSLFYTMSRGNVPITTLATPNIVPSWMMLGLSSYASAPGARERHWALFAPSVASFNTPSFTSSILTYNLTQSLGLTTTGPYVVTGGGLDYDGVFADVWVLDLGALPSSLMGLPWVSAVAPEEESSLVSSFTFSYLAYATSVALLTFICLVCLVKRGSFFSRLRHRLCGGRATHPEDDDEAEYMRQQQVAQAHGQLARVLEALAGAGMGAGGQGTHTAGHAGGARAQRGPRGVHPAIIAALPTVVFKGEKKGANSNNTSAPATTNTGAVAANTITADELASMHSNARRRAPSGGDTSSQHHSAVTVTVDGGVVNAGGNRLAASPASSDSLPGSVNDSPSPRNGTNGGYTYAVRGEPTATTTTTGTAPPTTASTTNNSSSNSNNSNNSDEPLICVICLDAFEDGARLKILPCLHSYHSTCVDEWLVGHSSCPLCKQDVASAVL